MEQLESRLLLTAPTLEWVRQFGGVGLADARPSAIDSAGNVYLFGSTNGTLPGQTSAGGTDLFVRKYNPSGTELWTRQFGTASTDGPWGIGADSSGVYLTGNTSGVLPGQTSAGGTDVFVRKYDPSGTELWTRQFGTASSDRGFGIAVDSSGVYVAGDTGGTLPGQANLGSADAFVRKYDASGTELWTRQFGTASLEGADSIAADSSGVYVAGYVDGSFPGQTNTGSRDVFVRKYDASGTELWTRQFGTTGAEIAASNKITVSSSGVHITGPTNGTFPGQVSAGSQDAYVRTYDVNGNELWTRQFGTALLDRATGIAADTSGVYVAGEAGGTLPGQVSAGSSDVFLRKYDFSGNEGWTRQFGTSSSDSQPQITADDSGIYVAGITTGTFPGEAKTGLFDAFVRKYGASGNELWTRQFGASDGPSAESASSVDASGNIYVAGQTCGTLPGQTSAGDCDAFIRKYDASGNELWTRQFGTAAFDSASGLASDGSGVYVAGSTSGTLPGQTSAGGQDAFVRKYDANGAEIWTRQFGTGGSDSGARLTVDASGLYMAGTTSETLPGQTSAGGQDAFVRKYDTSGTELWTRQFGSAGSDSASSLATHSSGFYVAGGTSGTLPGQSSAGSSDAFVRKYDANGNELWTRQFGTPSLDGGGALAADSSGVYVGGLTLGTFPGQSPLSPQGLDAYVRKYDPSGNELWTRQFGAGPTDVVRGIAISSSGVYVAGIVTGALPGQTRTGGVDAFVRKYDANGTELWTYQFGTAGGGTQATGISAHSACVLVVGDTSGVLPGQTSAGGTDAFVANLSENARPTADAVGPYTVAEGGSVMLDGSASSDPEQLANTLTYTWDLDGDGIYGETGAAATRGNETGAQPTFSAAGLDGPGTFTVSLRVTDDCGASHTDTATINITNLAPVLVGVTNTSPICGGARSGQNVSISGSYTDAGTPDTHSVLIDWGDGTSSPGTATGSNGSGTVAGSHTYAQGGVFTITVTLTDDDGGSHVQTTTAVVSGVRLSATGQLQIVGTDERDLVHVHRFDGIIRVHVRLGTPAAHEDYDDEDDDEHENPHATHIRTEYPTASVQSILILGCGGNDHLKVGARVTVAAAIDGGLGNDHIRGGGGADSITDTSGNNRIRAGAGNDTVTSGSGNDRIWTDDGADVIQAGDGHNTVHAGDGNDAVTTGSGCDEIRGGAGDDTVRAGAGNDRLQGHAGNDQLFGESGEDLLVGGEGRDLLVGGLGGDRIVGNADDDILIAGTTAFDNDAAALSAIMAEWTSTRDYATRTANLLGTGAGPRDNGTTFLLVDGAAVTVFDDGVRDVLTGGQGRDWFFAQLCNGVLDCITDLGASEFANDLDFINS